MSDKIEVDRADLAHIVALAALSADSNNASIAYARKLLEPAACVARWRPADNRAGYQCWLQEGHDGEHEVNSNCWVSRPGEPS